MPKWTAAEKYEPKVIVPRDGRDALCATRRRIAEKSVEISWTDLPTNYRSEELTPPNSKE
jgi:hypothetical protein